jgi:hypothetical protein
LIRLYSDNLKIIASENIEQGEPKMQEEDLHLLGFGPIFRGVRSILLHLLTPSDRGVSITAHLKGCPLKRYILQGFTSWGHWFWGFGTLAEKMRGTN